MDTNKKIRAVRKALGLSQSEFGKLLRVGISHVSEMETGRKNPSKALLDLLFIRCRIKKEWWDSGEGEMFEPASPEFVAEEQPSYQVSDLRPALQAFLEDYTSLSEDEQERIWRAVREAKRRLG